MSKHGPSTENSRLEDKRTRIQTWLVQEGWKVDQAQAEGALWIITATNETQQNIVVAQPQSLPDRIEIQATILLPDDRQKMFEDMDAKEREAVLWNLRFELLKLGVEFVGLAGPVVQEIRILQRIYDDGLTQDRFTQRISQVKAGAILTVWTISLALEQPTDELDSSFTN